jgi:hypothetical protein
MEFRIHERKEIFGSGEIAVMQGLEQPGNFPRTRVHPYLLC